MNSVLKVGLIAVATYASLTFARVAFDKPQLATTGERVCKVLDGDTIALCSGERIRLNGIDAPELPGHCRPGRRCVVGDPFAAKANLEKELRRGVIAITRLGKDRYGRTIAQVSVDGLDLSCAQIGAGGTIYREDWDNEHRTAGACD